jgi:hypothetical protein
MEFTTYFLRMENYFKINNIGERNYIEEKLLQERKGRNYY